MKIALLGYGRMGKHIDTIHQDRGPDDIAIINKHEKKGSM